MITVVGAGSWGTALALLLARNGHTVQLWQRDQDAALRMGRQGQNARYLPGFTFPPTLTSAISDLESALVPSDEVLVAVPSVGFRDTLRRIARVTQQRGADRPLGVTWATKGLDPDSGRWLHEVAAELLGADARPAVLSGPTFAREVAQELPAAVALGCADPERARHLVTLFHGVRFRVYANDDVAGVSLGGAVKNVLAIAAGVADGLSLGANTRAAIISRGLREMLRVGRVAGARASTLMGLAGLGDLVLTCTDDQSRNRQFGLALAEGLAPDEARARARGVVEGAGAAIAVLGIARNHGIEMPITEQVAAVVKGAVEPARAVESLLAREPASEFGEDEEEG